jgi:uncharacterized paraquat-inducible protein A
MNGNPSHIVACPGCGAKNRIPIEKLGQTARCGKCKVPFDTTAEAATPYTLRCLECGTKNRVRADRLGSDAKCGKCGALLKTREIFAPQPMMISDMNFDTMVMKSPLPVLLYAWSPS